MSEISDLQSYLATLGRDGRRDSQGRFSLSTEKALAKLAEFQLLDPSLYAVHLVAAAVTAQAQRVEISHATDRIEFEFDRPICQAEELDNLYSAVSIAHDHLAAPPGHRCSRQRRLSSLAGDHREFRGRKGQPASDGGRCSSHRIFRPALARAPRGNQGGARVRPLARANR